MKKVIISFFVMSILIGSLFASDKVYKSISVKNFLSKKEYLKQEYIFSDKTQVHKYIEFLISQNILLLDTSIDYEISIYDDGKKWLVLLFEKEENKNDTYIVDNFDRQLHKYFYVRKTDGAIL